MTFGPIISEPKRQRFKVYDLEWYPHSYVVRLVGVFDGSTYKSYLSLRDFLLGEMLSENHGCVYFAHAGGLADVQFVLAELLRESAGLSLQASFSGSAAIIVNLERGPHSWTFADSYWLLRDSLKKIGRSIGMEKGGAEYHCAGCAPASHAGMSIDPCVPGVLREQCEGCGHPEGHCIFYAPEKELRDYNELDCRILWFAIERLEEEVIGLGGELRMTIAGTALRLFRGAFLEQTIKTDDEVNDVARLAYVASRVEVFQHRLEGPAHIYDINSSFPYSMTKPQPGACIYRGFKWLKEDPLSLVRAEIHVPEDCAVPPIPCRHGVRVYFPVGTWTGWFSGVDLHFLLECGGRINRVAKAFRFEPFEDFRAYVETIYGRRKASTDDFQKLVYKYLMNALYGKTAETDLKEQLIIGRELPKGVKDAVSVCIKGKDVGFMYEKSAFVAHEHVPCAMTITAYSRRWIGEGLIRVGDSSYCDTDALTTKRPPPDSSVYWAAFRKPTDKEAFDPALAAGYEAEKREREAQLELERSEERFMDSPDLGQFKWEDAIRPGESAYFAAPKNYRFGKKIKAKGFSPKSKKGLTLDEFNLIVSGSAIEVKRMMRIKETLRSGDPTPRDLRGPGGGPFMKRMRLIERPKRRILEDGSSTAPWHVRELDEKWEKPKRERKVS